MKEKLFLLSLSGASVFLGTIYSIFNTDPHHWGFIVGTAVDFIHGKSLFTEIYVQYGVGQMILFKLLSYAIPINYTTVGIITSFAYALNFPILFACVKRISKSTHAILITALVFLIHPFAIYPWPDYFAGLSISLSCYFLVTAKQDNGHLRYAQSGVFLFLAFLFRNTYLLSIVTTIILYVCLSSFNKSHKEKPCYPAISVFLGLFASYYAFLLYQGNAVHWYVQNFGAALSVHGYGLDSVIRMVYDLVFTENLSFSVFLGLLVINSYMIIFMYKNADNHSKVLVHPDPWVGIFFCLLGCSGISQSIHILEIFRLQNAAIPLYLGLSLFLQTKVFSDLRANNLSGTNISIGILIAILIFRFPFILGGSPNASAIWPIIPKVLARSIQDSFQSFAKSDILIFNLHLFQAAEKKYYEELYAHLCDGKRRIVNLTMDSTVPYLCPGQDNALSLPFYNYQLLHKINEREARRVLAGEFLASDVIVTDLPPPLNKDIVLQLIGTIERPVGIRWMLPGMVSVFHVQASSSRK